MEAVKTDDRPDPAETERLELLERFNLYLEKHPTETANNIARSKIGVSEGTLSQWRNDKYGAKFGEVNAKMRLFLDRAELSDEVLPDLKPVKTDVFQGVQSALSLADSTGRGIVVNSPPGFGKTFALTEYAKANPSALLALSDASWRSPQWAAYHLAGLLSGDRPSRRLALLVEHVEKALRRKRRFLIIDDAQNLSFRSVELLCAIADRVRLPFALVGHDFLVERLVTQERIDSELWDRVRSRLYWWDLDPDRSNEKPEEAKKRVEKYRKDVAAIAGQILPKLPADALDLLADPITCGSIRDIVKVASAARTMQLNGAGAVTPALIRAAVALSNPPDVTFKQRWHVSPRKR